VQALGAGYAVSEMVTSRKDLWNSLKTSRRANHEGEPADRGADRRHRGAMMAEAAVYNIERGAQIIDINMGCPAKKVCNKWAGSALMQDEALALSIAEAVVQACRPPCAGHAEDAHRLVPGAQERAGAGARLRGGGHPDADRARPHARAGLQGPAEYDTIAAVKAAVRIPVANGDIDSPQKAARCWPTPAPTR
jgi:tRNA-dihydrouridine synthase B